VRRLSPAGRDAETTEAATVIGARFPGRLQLGHLAFRRRASEHDIECAAPKLFVVRSKLATVNQSCHEELHRTGRAGTRASLDAGGRTLSNGSERGC